MSNQAKKVDEMTPAEIQALLDEKSKLEARVETLEKASSSSLSFKQSIRTGAMSLYGMGRNPVTLYNEQWLKLFTMHDEYLETTKGINFPTKEESLQQKALYDVWSKDVIGAEDLKKMDYDTKKLKFAEYCKDLRDKQNER